MNLPFKIVIYWTKAPSVLVPLMRIDDDGIIRRASLLFRADDNIYPSLALESLRVAQGISSIVLRASDVRGEGLTHRVLACRA